MKPILFHLPEWLGGHPIPTYGLLLGVGCVAGALVWTYLVSRTGRPALPAFEVALTVMVVAILSSKVVGLLFQPPSDLSLWQKLATTGGVWYVGFLSGVAAAAVGVRRLGLTTLEGLDLAAPAVAVGHAIGRLACLFAGCCYGRHCDMPWSVTFTDERAAAATGVPLHDPLHPTAIYESVSELALAAFLFFLVLRRMQLFRGMACLGYFIGYSVIRFVVECFRADERGSLGPLSTSQVIAVALLTVCLPLLILGVRRAATGARRPEARDR